MNYAAFCQLVLGKPALERVEKLLEVLDSEELVEAAKSYLAMRAGEKPSYVYAYDLDEEDGYIVIYSTGPEGEFSDAAREVQGFALEVGPDSGGPGWVTDGERAVDLEAWALPKAAELYREWAERTPPAGKGALEAFCQAVLEAASREAA